MRDLIGRYLEEQGRSTSYLLATGALLLSVLVAAWTLYAAGSTVWFLVIVTWTAFTQPSAMHAGIAFVLWLVALLWLMLTVAGRELFLVWRQRRWNAEIALDSLEARLPATDSSRHLGHVRERLAHRGLDAIAAHMHVPRAGDACLEERLAEIERASTAATSP